MSGETWRREDGFQTWRCYCGARGLGSGYVLKAHQATHPLVRMAVARGLRALARWVDRLGLRAQTLHGGEGE